MTTSVDYKGVWILAEQSDGVIRRISYELLTRGRALADKRRTELVALLIGPRLDDNQLRTLIDCGADRVVTMEAHALAKFIVEPHAACMQKVIATHHPEIIIAGATSTGRTLMPYVAARVHAGLTADCTQLDIDVASGQLLQTRPAIGGNIMATIRTPNQRPQMATVRPRSTPPAIPQKGRHGEIMRLSAETDLLASRITHVRFIASDSEHGLQDADAILAVGRGVRKPENLPVVRETADALNAALAASREVVDRGWMSYPHQVGLSGKTVSPKLYVAVGVSGAIQHLAGMQTAETIVAVNSDPDAPIFGVADFAIVGDMFEVLPRLSRRLKREKKR